MNVSGLRENLRGSCDETHDAMSKTSRSMGRHMAPAWLCGNEQRILSLHFLETEINYIT